MPITRRTAAATIAAVYRVAAARAATSAGAIALIAALAVACSSSKQPISVMGDTGDLEALAGSWVGTYHSDNQKTRGTIEFLLDHHADTASGSVVMYAPGVDPHHGGEDVPAARLLIRFVQAEGGWISGRLDPYEDPECQCVVETLFRGKIEGDSMAGNYTTRGVYESFVRTGTWTATRAFADVPPGTGKHP
jgi:hypothetical protein